MTQIKYAKNLALEDYFRNLIRRWSLQVTQVVRKNKFLGRIFPAVGLRLGNQLAEGIVVISEEGNDTKLLELP